MKRRFNQTERIALNWASAGMCAMCGKPLQSDWQADHVIPFSKGGSTNVTNGQAVCPKCNLHKGASMDSWIYSFCRETWGCDPRFWQVEAFEKLIAELNRLRLINVTPAAGKTMFGVIYGAYLLKTRHVDKIVVIVPTTGLLQSWVEEFGRAGIHLDPSFNKTYGVGADFGGVASTYASVFVTPHVFARYFPSRTLVIFDEIHHLADENGWGQQSTYAFNKDTNYFLGTTGTAFRASGTETISFARYDVNGDLVADFNYGYAKAIADGIVRQVYFPTWDALLAEYIRNGKRFEATFDPSLPDGVINDALRCFIDRDSQSLREMIIEANTKLQSPLLRGGGDRAAGGIFFGNRCEDLDVIQKNIFNKLGVRSLVVHSGEGCEDPDGDIERFRKDPSYEWILCVRKVSEGINLKRLRVGVHGSTWTAALSFRQMIGRIIRRTSETDIDAFYYVPKHPELIKHAMQIYTEILHAKEIEKERETKKRDVAEPFNKSYFIPIDALGEESDHIVAGDSIYIGEIAYASSVVQKADMASEVSEHALARLLKAAGSLQTIQKAAPTQTISVRQQKDDKSNKISKMMRRAAMILVDKGRYPNFDAARYYIMNDVLAKLDGIYGDQKDVCSLPQLDARLACVINLLERITR